MSVGFIEILNGWTHGVENNEYFQLFCQGLSWLLDLMAVLDFVTICLVLFHPLSEERKNIKSSNHYP